MKARGKRARAEKDEDRKKIQSSKKRIEECEEIERVGQKGREELKERGKSKEMKSERK